MIGIDATTECPFTGGCDDAAVDGEAAIGINGSYVTFTGDGEAPRACALTIDGKGVLASEVDGIAARVILYGHFRTVGEDDVNDAGVALSWSVDLARVAEAGADNIPACFEFANEAFGVVD